MQGPGFRARASAVDFAICLGLFGLALVFWKLQLFDPPASRPFALQGFGGADFYKEAVPIARETARQWLEGRLPLWNPYQLAGRPLLAMPLVGAFYPPNVVYLLFSPAVAIEILIALHVAAAGIFTYAFARSIAVSRLSSVGAGVCFMLSGFVSLTATWAAGAVSTVVWLPLGLLAVEQIVKQPRAQWVALLAFAVAMQMFAGWVQIWTYSLLALGVYGALRVLMNHGMLREPLRIVLAAACLSVGVGLGLGLSAVQLLPSQELHSLSSREGDLDAQQAVTFGFATGAQVLESMVAPKPLDPSFAYLGRAAILLLPLALFARGRAMPIVCFGGLGLLALVIGVNAQAYEAFRWLPTASWFRQPWRLVFLFAFGGSMLIGIVLDDLRRKSQRVRALSLGALVLGIATSVQLALPVRGLDSAVLWVAASLICAVLLSSNVRARTAIVVGLIAVLGLDLFASREAIPQRPIHAPEVVEGAPDLYQYLRANQGYTRTLMYAVASRDLMTTDMRSTAEHIYSMTDYSGLSLGRFGQFFDAIDSSPPDRGVLPFTGDFSPDPTSPRLRMLRLLSFGHLVALPRQARALLTSLQQGHGRWNWKHRAQGRSLDVYQAPDPLPRAYVAFDSIAAKDGSEALEILSRPEFPIGQTVVLEGIDVSAREGLGRALVPATITDYEVDYVSIEAEADVPGFLVLADTYYPGWKAFVDGEAVTILRANYLLRAVALEPGVHRVTFRYDPLNVKIGIAISLVSASLLLAAMFWGLQRRRV